MKQKKQRVSQHVMEDESYALLKKYIPKEWVVREFNRPDYGIDLIIELFDKINDTTSETLGEFIYVQVKSMKHIDVKLEKVYPVHNVSKYKWSEDKSMYKEIEVIKYPFDVTSIYTLQTLGASISVVLFLVDLSTEDVYFLCLNDYIDKIILPMKPNYTDQKTLTLTIPTLNNLKDSALSDIALRFYGKRAKLLAAFSKFYYQNNELRYLVPGNVEIIERALFFISQIEDLDIWKYIEWGALSIARERIVNLKKYLNSNNFDLYTASDKIFENWRLLTNLGSIYEDLCREWFLPKYISILTSYPEV